MKLPLDFVNKMNSLLVKEEFDEFIKSFDKPRFYGLRVNTLKISIDDFIKISPFKLEKIPWSADGFYYTGDVSPGKHPYYHAGLYYIQEPSAMLPAALIDAKPGDRVLDLCAAPGGKTVQMAAGMKGQGILIANDVSANRLKPLVKNIEQFGIKNAIVTNETPGNLAMKFNCYFDKILIDAPCSGEGMFRKDPEAIRSWEKYKCEKCCKLQADILGNAGKMLKTGGIMVYSTCTFSPEEDEKIISDFLTANTDYELLDIPKTEGMDNGRPEWSDGNSELIKTARLWPHKINGEGHFAAMIMKKADTGRNSEPVTSAGMQITYSSYANLQDRKHSEAFESFVRNNMDISLLGRFNILGNNLYCLLESPPDLNGIKVAKFGWYLGEFLRDEFIPSHSLAIALEMTHFKRSVNLSASSLEIISYLKGETLMIDGDKGLTAICVDGYTVGWAKQMGEMLKNLYPKGWRKLS